jgi:hypothetical protein
VAVEGHVLDSICCVAHIHDVAEVIALDEFTEWYHDLSEGDSAAVYRVVNLLEARGVTLDHPYCSAILDSNMALRELRVQSGGRPLRILYAFDPKRQAVLILGGDKTGDERFYEREVPKAERLFIKYLTSVEAKP